MRECSRPSVLDGDIVQYLKGARQKNSDFKDLFAKERKDLEALKIPEV
jgi:hypothetical protein